MFRFAESYVTFAVLALSMSTEIASALSILIAAIFVGLVNLYVARTSRLVALREVAKALAPIKEKVEEMAPVLAKVEGHVNSEKTKAVAEAVAMSQQIELQREMIEEMKKAAALLAQAKSSADLVTAASHGVAPVLPAVPVVVAADEAASLRQIDTNTAQTAENTARTEEVVKHLDEKS